MIVLVGFSLLGAVCGALLGVIGGVIGIFYQLVKVASIFFKVAFCCEARLERRHRSSTASPVPSSLDSAGLFSDTSVISDEPSFVGRTGPKRTLCCIRLPNTCPVCKTVAYKFDSNNDMTCLVCGANWCWTCRKRIDESKLGDLHFEWYNVFGCPGLKHTPNHFLTGLAAKVLVSLLFPLTLLFAPLVVSMANYKPGSNLVKDQATRFRQQVGILRVHMNAAKVISLLGFSFLGLAAAVIIVPVFGTAGILYQFVQVLVLLCRGLCGDKSSIREEDNLSEYDSPAKNQSPSYSSPFFYHSSASNIANTFPGAGFLMKSPTAASQFKINLKNLSINNEDEEE